MRDKIGDFLGDSWHIYQKKTWSKWKLHRASEKQHEPEKVEEKNKKKNHRQPSKRIQCSQQI